MWEERCASGRLIETLQMAYFILVVFIIAIAVLFYTFTMFDHLIQAEYDGDREAREADGRPR